MTQGFVEPRYHDLALANLLPSVEAVLTGGQPVIAIPRARTYVVLLVDGLGIHQLREHGGHAEVLSAMPGLGPITCSVPSTTAASLTSLGCGLPPGRHGVVGYSFFDPMAGGILNALTWQGGPADVGSFAQERTVFQRLEAQGRRSAAVTLRRFSDSALTRLAFSGSELWALPDQGGLETVVSLVKEAVREVDLVYCYERMLDHDGHGYGVGSWQWLSRLGMVDDLVARLTATLPEEVCLLVTGDHGMVNVPEEARIIVEDETGLRGLVGGEPRLRYVYGEAPADLALSWARVLGDRAMVMRREEAVEAGWFGAQPSRRSLERIGQIVVAMNGEHAIMTRNSPKEFGLIGMHGSLTADEMEIPLLIHGGDV